MPAISGSTVAPKQARFGILRFGASRFGDFQPKVRVLINGTDRAALVHLETLRISDRLNDVPNVAQWTQRQGSSAPSVGQPVIVSQGNATDRTRDFAGYIIRVKQRQAMSAQAVVYDVTARDATWKLDKRLVSATYSGSATDVARQIVEDWTELTANGVETGLPDIGDLVLTNVRPSVALTRLATLAGDGCAWYVDEHEDLQFGTDLAVTAAPTLNDAYPGFWDFLPDGDLAQLRTRVIVEGKHTTCPLGVRAGFNDPTGSVHGSPTTFVPIDNTHGFYAGGGSGYARVGSELVTYALWATNTAADGTNPIGSTVRTDVNPGDTVIEVESATYIADVIALSGGNFPRFSRVGDQVIFHLTGNNVGAYSELQLIPASGYGAIAAPIPAGAMVQPLGHLAVLTTPIAADQPPGCEIVLRAIADDTAAQAAIAAIEGGDGVHEMLVQDGRLSYAGALARAEAELASGLSAEVRAIGYRTRHPSVRSGRTVSVSLSSPASVSGDFLIREVQISGFDACAPRTAHTRRVFPIRHVQASTVKVRGFMGQLSTGEDGL